MSRWKRRKDRGYCRREKWCQRGIRVFRKRWTGRHDIYTVLARYTEPEEGAPFGGVLVKPWNMRRTGRTRPTPYELMLAERHRIRLEVTELWEILDELNDNLAKRYPVHVEAEAAP